MTKISAWGLGVFLLAAGCSPARVCDPGATQHCVCATGDGAQVCASDGTSWGACSCGTTDAGMPTDAHVTTDALASDTGVDAATPAGDAELDAATDCTSTATAATVTEIANGTVGAGTAVHVSTVVAMSHSFLLARSNTSGSCLWGAFVSAPGLTTTAPYSGLLVTSFGTMATIPPGGTTPVCPVLGVTPTGSMIPDDLAPGDEIDVAGMIQSFVPTACATTGGTSVPQTTLSATCRFVVTGHTAVPAPAVLSGTDVDALANQTIDIAHGQWGSVFVRIEGVTPMAPTTGSCAGGTMWSGDTFGNFTLAGSGLVVGEKIYFSGALAASDPCHRSPSFCAGSAAWTAIEGFHYLDFCTWSLEVADPCSGFAPQASGCAAASCD